MSATSEERNVVQRPGSISVGQVDVVVEMDVSNPPLVNVVALITNFDYWGSMVTTKNITILFNNIPCANIPSEGFIEMFDLTHANPRATWETNGSPLYPSKEEIAQELAASVLAAENLTLAPVADSKDVSAIFAMEPNSVA